MPSSPALRLALLAVAATALACSDPLAAPDRSGRFALASVNAVPIPHVVIDDTELFIEVIADTLLLQSDGTGVWRSHYRWRTAGGPLSVSALEVPFTIDETATGPVLQQRPDCPSELACELPPAARITVQPETIEATIRFGTHRWRRVGSLD